jgi:hypothetical protein
MELDTFLFNARRNQDQRRFSHLSAQGSERRGGSQPVFWPGRPAMCYSSVSVR